MKPDAKATVALKENRPGISHMIGPRGLANILGVKVGTVFSWLSRGIDLPPSIKIGGTTRWRPEAVSEWIREREQDRRRRNFQE